MLDRSWRLFASFLALSGASGCIPIPHREQDAPAILGVVSQGRTGLSGAEVHRQIGGFEEACTGGDVTVADENGRFRFPARDHQETFIMFGDKWYPWEIGFKAPDGGCVTWGPYTIDTSVTVECNLGAPSKEPKHIGGAGAEALQRAKMNGAAEDIGAGCSWH